jgi:hypothetical protein
VSGRSNRGLALLLFGILVLLNGVIMRPLLLQDEFVPGELKQGSFDVLAGETTLLLDDLFLNELYPLIDLYAGGELGIPPGYSVAFPLEPRLEYRVRIIDRTIAPYIVLGAALPLSSSVRLDGQTADPVRPPNPMYLAGGQVLSLDAGDRLELRPWSAGRPWRVDARWLSDLTSVCSQPNEPLVFSVREQDQTFALRLGRCAGEATLAVPPGASLMMAVLTGPSSTVVEKTPERWRYRSRIVLSDVTRFAALLMVIQAGIVALAVGLVNGLVLIASLSLASVFFPFEAAVVWLVVGVLGIFIALFRLARRLGSPLGAVLMAVVLVGLPVALLVWWSAAPPASPGDLDLHQAAFDASEGTPRCLLTGYSTAADAGLHYGTPGIYGLLGSTCPTCPGGVTRIAWRGGSVAQIRDTICAPNVPIGPGYDVIFLGGVNDDFQLPLQAKSPWERVRAYFMAAQIIFTLRDLPKPVPAFDASQRLMVSADMARRNVSVQLELIRQAVQCAERRGGRFWYFHDYLASDLAEGRPPGRAVLLDQRRTAVDPSRARFVNLLEATADRAGVSWFNDIVHLSAIGHREVEQVICGALAADRSGGGP